MFPKISFLAVALLAIGGARAQCPNGGVGVGQSQLCSLGSKDVPSQCYAWTAFITTPGTYPASAPVWPGPNPPGGWVTPFSFSASIVDRSVHRILGERVTAAYGNFLSIERRRSVMRMLGWPEEALLVHSRVGAPSINIAVPRGPFNYIVSPFSAGPSRNTFRQRNPLEIVPSTPTSSSLQIRARTAFETALTCAAAAHASSDVPALFLDDVTRSGVPECACDPNYSMRATSAMAAQVALEGAVQKG
ncbi:hypothetical protein DFH09DRAFT_1069233 [Mycena vulgaris]|nr:hypothetical protein DFH09DRAFT_1069233 [Mycena vulgaris]